MASPRLENYLRTYRKRSGLTQREVAFLLGSKNGAQLSRYEKQRRLPPLRTALAFVVFEDPRQVLDWGARSFRGGVNAVRIPLGPKVARLLDEYVPKVLVLKYPQTKTVKQIIQVIRKQARAYKIPVRIVSPKVLQ